MKLAKNFAAATLLVFVFSLTSFAGDQQTPGCVSPPPTHAATTAPEEKTEVKTDADGKVVPVIEDTSDHLWYDVLLGLLSVY